MQKNKAIQILRTFTTQEFKDFGKFVSSPYFNTSREVIQLFTYLKKYFPTFDNKALDINIAVKKLSKSAAVTEGSLRNTLTVLNKLARKFLTIESFTKTDYKVKSEEIFALENKKFDNKKEMNDYFSVYGEMHHLGEEYHSETLRLYNVRAGYAQKAGKPYNDIEAYVKRSEIACLNALDYMIHCTTTVATLEFNYNLKYVDLCAEMFKVFDFEKFLNYTKSNSPKIYKILIIEYYLIKMSLNQDFEKNNEKVKAYFLENYENPSMYMGYIVTVWKNTFKTRINFYVEHHEIKSTAKLALSIIDLEMEKKLYLVKNPHLHLTSFLSSIDLATLAEEAEWINQFVIKYQDELDEQNKDYAVNYSKGVYNLLNGNYVEALSYYSKVIKSDSLTFMKVRFDMLLCHYELGNYETALSLCETLLRYLERNYEGHIKKWQVSEIKLFRKLLKIASDSSFAGINDLEAEIKTAPKRSQLYILKYLNKLKISVKYK